VREAVVGGWGYRGAEWCGSSAGSKRKRTPAKCPIAAIGKGYHVNGAAQKGDKMNQMVATATGITSGGRPAPRTSMPKGVV